MSQQPSWAHVVRGARAGSQHPQFHITPPPPLLPPPGNLCVLITVRVIQLAKARLEEVGERLFGVDAAGVHPEFRDEYVREQLDKKAKALDLAAEKSAQLVEDVEDAVEVAEADFFVAGEIIKVADQSIFHLEESQVLVQPNYAVYNEVVGQEDGDENVEMQ